MMKGISPLIPQEYKLPIREYYKYLYADKLENPKEYGYIPGHIHPSKTKPGRS